MNFKFDNDNKLTKNDKKNLMASLTETIESLTNRGYSLDDSIKFKLFNMQIFAEYFYEKETITNFSEEEYMMIKAFIMELLKAMYSQGPVNIRDDVLNLKDGSSRKLTTPEYNFFKRAFELENVDEIIDGNAIEFFNKNKIKNIKDINYLYIIFRELQEKKQNEEKYSNILKAMLKVYNKNRTTEEILAEKIK